MVNKVKAIGLLSGGLDSTLAARIIKDQGIEILGLNFYTGFCITEHRRRVGGRRVQEKNLRNEALRAGADLKIPVEFVDISDEYLQMVTAPRYGYGSNVNPCIDCRIYMLRRARELMMEKGAYFIFTGEVLGQRPMSQHLPSLRLIEKESKLDRLILRPLSARLLPVTIPEEKGWVYRDRLFDIQGRSRKRQIALAKELGIKDYPQPAGGCCFLTDENYAERFLDHIKYSKGHSLGKDDILLLAVGRHFRLPEGIKIIVGRDEDENQFLEGYTEGRWVFRVVDYPGPLVLAYADNELREADLHKIASIAARYSDGKNREEVEVEYSGEGLSNRIKVKPQDDETLRQWRLGH